MKYQIESEFTMLKLELRIKSLIKKGWKPQGGIAIAKSPTGFTKFYQVMIKEETT